MEKVKVIIISQDGRLVAKEVNRFGDKPNKMDYPSKKPINMTRFYNADLISWQNAEANRRVFEIEKRVISGYINGIPVSLYYNDYSRIDKYAVGSTHTAQVIEGNKVIII